MVVTLGSRFFQNSAADVHEVREFAQIILGYVCYLRNIDI